MLATRGAAEKRVRNGAIRTKRCILAIGQRKKSPVRALARVARRVPRGPAAAPGAARMVEDIVGCKWSLIVLDLVTRGVARPGAMQREVPGLTAKVLNERLRKLIRFGLIEREVFAEVPPHVEYRLTPLGRRFGDILERISALDRELGAPLSR